MEDFDKLLDTNETAEILGIHPKSLRELLYRKSKHIPPFIWIGNRRRWRKSTVLKWLEENETTK